MLPHQSVNQSMGINADVQLSIKRLDLIHPHINGNKYFKLKYNIEKVMQSEHRTLLTFGGAFSNHIYSTAAAGKEFGFKTIGVIRGEKPKLLSPTLRFAQECGMQLEFVTREAYSQKGDEDFQQWLRQEYGNFHLVPEGGSNFLGVNGCMEILQPEDSEFDFICCACGTGATLAGLALGMKTHQRLLGFSALKNGSFLHSESLNHINSVLNDAQTTNEFSSRIEIITDYHFGGYAKRTPVLMDFIRHFESATGIPLDHVYTGKMMYGIHDQIENGYFRPGAKILAIHTGGLQDRGHISR